MFQERLSSCRTNSRNGIQLGSQTQLCPFFAMRRDPEAVGFVADSLHEVESLRMAGEQQRLALVREENLLLLLGKPHHRHFIH